MLHEEFRQTTQEGWQAGYGEDAWLTDWECTRTRIGLKLIGRAGNQSLLERAPHRPVLDLALVCYLSFEMGRGCSGAVVIQNHNLNRWGIPEEELFRQAERNREILFPSECIPMEQMLASLIIPEVETAGEFPDLCGPFHAALEELPLYVITNRQRSLGASAILSPGLLLRLTSEKGWADCFLLPSSIHEMIALPGTMTDMERLRWMVRDVNECAVRPEDLLSYSVYRYSRLRNAICLEGEAEWYPLEY
ncbi:MAG: DUF5688 family protein [Lachnospiraceae bacterium]|nr:DUF5688 family protein [Lachnospiraceae bacterium]